MKNEHNIAKLHSFTLGHRARHRALGMYMTLSIIFRVFEQILQGLAPRLCNKYRCIKWAYAMIDSKVFDSWLKRLTEQPLLIMSGGCDSSNLSSCCKPPVLPDKCKTFHTCRSHARSPTHVLRLRHARISLQSPYVDTQNHPRMIPIGHKQPKRTWTSGDLM